MRNLGSRVAEQLFQAKTAHRLTLGCAAIHVMLCAVVAVWTNTWLLWLTVAVPGFLFPLYMTQFYPNALLSRLTIAMGFMALTALLIEQTGGDQESHFSFFVMISILVVYCDWRPLVFACVLILLHHLFFALLQPLGLGFYVWNDHRNAWGHLTVHAAAVTIQTGALCYLACILSDRYRLAHENRKLGREMKLMSAKVNLDLLTGLCNRFYLSDWLAQFAQSTKFGAESTVVCIMDLDHFRMINDRYGHNIGDDALRLVGAVIRGELAPDDVAVRYGGEEFLLILRGLAPEGAVLFAERLRQKIAAQNVFGHAGSFCMTASFGLAKWEIGEDFHDVFRRADRALYQAKSLGRNRVENAGCLSARVVAPEISEIKAVIAAM